jgi:hypothetical protein
VRKGLLAALLLISGQREIAVEGPVASSEVGAAARLPGVLPSAGPRGEEEGPEREPVRTTRADRVAEEVAAAQEGRVNRERLLARNLADLEAAALRAEREGKAEYAAALRRRAVVLGQSVQME